MTFEDKQLNLFEEEVNRTNDFRQEQKGTFRKVPELEPSWLNILSGEFDKPYMNNLRKFLVDEKKHYTVYPEGKNMFNAFRFTPFDEVKVVILGQDPYHGPNQAHGLCFSVQRGVPPPPSLVNIFKELNSDLSVPFPQHGCLTSWAKQGVFLLNTVLSVRAGSAHSHAGKGWEIYTDRVISELSKRRENLVFILWGRPAQSKIPSIDANKHLILKSPHPSPLSANNGFWGCRHFSKVNDYLERTGQNPVDWILPP
jgi:uracil-DNA glycosylase